MKKFIVVLIAAAGYFYFFKPYISLSEVRASSDPVELTAVFVNVTPDPSCIKLYKLDRMDDNVPVASNEPIVLALPEGMPSPENGKLAYSDNVFTLKGYSYKYVERNKFNNESNTSPSHRFDVIAWTVVPPYKMWKESDPGGDSAAEAETSSGPVSHKIKSNDHSPDEFIIGACEPSSLAWLREFWTEERWKIW